jgi:hypothetical protein
VFHVFQLAPPGRLGVQDHFDTRQVRAGLKGTISAHDVLEAMHILHG